MLLAPLWQDFLLRRDAFGRGLLRVEVGCAQVSISQSRTSSGVTQHLL